MSDEECTTDNVTNKPDNNGDDNNVTINFDKVILSLDMSSELYSGSANGSGDTEATKVEPEDERNIGKVILFTEIDGSPTPAVACDEPAVDSVTETATPDGTTVLVEENMTESQNDGECNTWMMTGRLRSRSSRRVKDRRNMTKRRPSGFSGDTCDNAVKIHSKIRPQLVVRRGIIGDQCTSTSSDHEYNSGDRWRSCRNVQSDKVLLAAKGRANQSGRRDRSSTKGRRKPKSSKTRSS